MKIWAEGLLTDTERILFLILFIDYTKKKKKKKISTDTSNFKLQLIQIFSCS